MMLEILILGVLIYIILEYNGSISTNKFVMDNSDLFKKLKEKDFEFYAKAKYGDSVDVEKLFNVRLRNGLLVILMMVFLFITDLNYANILFCLIAGYGVFKLSYLQLKKYYKSHLHKIDLMLPYYLKNLEILVQHYTVPVALGKSIEEAPNIFKEGLKTLIEKINAGDSTINPYMEFAKEYPVRDSMRMMRLLFRLSLGSNERKQEQLLTFSRNISSLQQKAREARYKERLEKMESKTMVMLVTTGVGVMVLLVISILMMFTAT
ncbi:MAG: hypothetical protein GX265_04710 [Mollicutes bacterium]|nr:hypothetical protein [Mollicutes bacterium]